MRIRINPKVDYVFKKLFGSEKHKSLLIDLLNAILLPFVPEPILDVDLLNPFHDKEDLNDKLSIFDIKARDNSGRLYNIEMQIAAFAFFPRRVLYYWSRLYQQQLHEGENYAELKPAISIIFVDSALFPGDSFHTEFALTSQSDPKVNFCPDLSIHLIELPKFAVKLEMLSTPLDRWCFFLRFAEDLDPTAIPEQLRTPPIEQATEVLNIMAQSEIERERYEARQKAIHDEVSIRYEMRRSAEEAQRHIEEAQRRTEEAQRRTEEAQRRTEEAQRHIEEAQRRTEEAQLEELLNSIEVVLDVKFGAEGLELMANLRWISDFEKLRVIQQSLRKARSIDEIKSLL